MMTEEVELKLAIATSDIATLRARPALAGAKARRSFLDATYLDTSGHALRGHGLALRLRREGRRWMQTLKADNLNAGALTIRPEWESAARIVQGVPRLDHAALAASPLPALLASGPRRARLIPIFRTRFQRTVWLVERGRSTIEVALDVGTVSRSKGSRTIRTPICEVELELKSGSARQLFALALELMGKGTDCIALVPLPLSKAERGYLLATGKRPPVVKASATGFVQALNGRMSTKQALRAVGRHALQLVLANAEGLRAGRDAEAIHQARVALRRFRSAVRLLDRRFDDFPQSLATEVRWLAQALGAARDWDVFSDETWPEFIAASTATVVPDAEMTELLQRALVRRDVERAAALSALSSVRYARTILRLQRWIASPPPRAESLRAMAARALEQAHQRLLDAARFFAALSPEQRHQVRIFAKRLRYSLDLLSVALLTGDGELFTGQLAELQDVLGVINDAAVAAPLVAELGASPALVGRAHEWFFNRAEARLRETEQRLLALSLAPRPWRKPRRAAKSGT